MISYSYNLDGITADQLAGGFWVGWLDHPSPARHLEILKGSYAVWLAIDDASGAVIGFINAVSDGLLSAYIPLLEVLPEYQSSGVGTQLMQRMLATLGHLYQVDLVCDEELQPYYERFGMRRASAMMLRNYHRQDAGS